MQHKRNEQSGHRPPFGGHPAAAALVLAVTAVSAAGVPRIERVSVSSAGLQGNHFSVIPKISADGRFIAFESVADNLVPRDTNDHTDVFVRDRAGAITERVSVSSADVQGNGESENPSISADGRYVAFQSDAGNLVPGDTNDTLDIFVRDRLMGTTERVSVDSMGVQATGPSGFPSISADGRFVAFISIADNLVSRPSIRGGAVFVRDRVSGTTECVSVSSTGAPASGDSIRASISADGRFVAFDSDAANLVPDDTNGRSDIFVRDRSAGTTERVSLTDTGLQANGTSESPSIGADGRFVAFMSDASNLAPGGPARSWYTAFVRDRTTGTTERVNVTAQGGEGNRGSWYPAISADGRFVAFSSDASDLVSGDTNGLSDVFIRDRATRTTERVSISADGLQANRDGYQPSVSADGRLVAFESVADNLVAGDTNGFGDVFVAERSITGP